jgi:hypothetical protein
MPVSTAIDLTDYPNRGDNLHCAADRASRRARWSGASSRRYLIACVFWYFAFWYLLAGVALVAFGIKTRNRTIESIDAELAPRAKTRL